MKTHFLGAWVKCDAPTTSSERLTFVDVARVRLLPRLASLLLLTRWSSGSLLAGLLLVGGSLTSWGLATSGGLLLGSFGRHF